jgi:Beta-propeller repeat
MESGFKRRNWYWAAVILFLCLYPGCGGNGSSSNLLLPEEGGGNGNPGSDPGTDPGTSNATVQFGSTRFDGATGTAVDSLGNVYVAGNTWGTIDLTHPNHDPTASTADVFIAKYDRDGVLQWVRQLGTPFNEFLTGIAVDRQDNVIVVGFTFGDLFGANDNSSNTTSDFFLCKVDPAGAQILAIQEGTADIDEVWGVTTDGDSNIYIAGGSRGDLLGTINTGDFDAFVASYDASGSLRWGGARTVGPAPLLGIPLENRDLARTLVHDGVRGILYAAGDFWTPDERGVGIFVEKLDPATGERIAWNPVNSNPYVFLRVLDDALQLSFATGIALDREGSIYISGYEIANNQDTSSNAGDATYIVFKIDSSANLLWHTYVFGGRGENVGMKARGLAVDSMEDVYLVGYTSVALDNSVHLGETDAFIMQLDGNTGARLWTRQFGTIGYDRAFGIAIDRNRPDTILYVAGETNGSLDGRTNRGGYDAFLVRYDQFGRRL